MYAPPELKWQKYARKIKAELHSHFESKALETTSGKVTTFANVPSVRRRAQSGSGGFNSSSERRSPEVRDRSSGMRSSPMLKERESPSKTRSQNIANSSRMVRPEVPKSSRKSVTPPPNTDDMPVVWRKEKDLSVKVRSKSIAFSSRGVPTDNSLGVRGLKKGVSSLGLGAVGEEF